MFPEAGSAGTVRPGKVWHSSRAMTVPPTGELEPAPVSILSAGTGTELRA
jgi:hypothetical protein